ASEPPPPRGAGAPRPPPPPAVGQRRPAAAEKGGAPPPLSPGAPRAPQGPTRPHRPDGRRPRHPAALLFRLPRLRSRRLRRRPHPGPGRLRHRRGLPDGLPAGRAAVLRGRPARPRRGRRLGAGRQYHPPAVPRHRRRRDRPAAAATATGAERATAEAVAQAAGDPELQIDAGKVNTAAGWRDVKVAVFARRPRGAPTTAAQWDERDLPAPAVRSVVAAVEEAAAFGQRCAAEAGRVRGAGPGALGGAGGGGGGGWDVGAQRLPGAPAG